MRKWMEVRLWVCTKKMESRRRQRKRVFCPHCNAYVSKSLYYLHKNIFFDDVAQSWMGHSDTSHSAAVPDFEFSPDIPENVRESDNGEDSSNHMSQANSDDDHNEEFEFDIDDESENTHTGTNNVTQEDGVDLFVSDGDTSLVDDVEPFQNDSQLPESNKLIQVFLMFLFFWQALFRISDAGITMVLSFVVMFLKYCGQHLGLLKLIRLAQVFPNTLYQAKKYLGTIKDNFRKYVVCSSCRAVYTSDECWQPGPTRGSKVVKRCAYADFPNHVQARMRAPCGNLLLRLTRTPTGSEYLAPYQTFSYKSVVDSLQDLLNRPMFSSLCEQWRNCMPNEGNLCDVYDGKMWEHFMYDTNGLPFLSVPNNFLLMFNCDWYQPFKHTPFSVGVMYLVIANLPRHVRFLQENVILVGIIPGPTEPKKNINTFLEPLVEELLALWKGVSMSIGGKPVTVRAALSCIACDVPAARKVGGFIGHRGKRGCSKCLKVFPTIEKENYLDYSGFKKNDWEPRSHAVHVKSQEACTNEDRQVIESSHGARYTLLYDLPYYDAIASVVVDPMHCLFLGIAKRCFSTWVSKGIIKKEHYTSIQNAVDSFKCPPDVGRIPYKLGSKFSGLKADQWKNWTLYFSLYALKSILPYKDYSCWLLFVKACTKLCKREISVSSLAEIDNLIEKFCASFLSLYGKLSLTPNRHLAGHLTDCVRDHGPVYAFWLYAFERMNGILGSFQTNSIDISVQLMRKFSRLQQFSLDQWPVEMREEFAVVFKDCKIGSGSFLETTYASKSTDKPIPPLTEKSLEDYEIAKIIATLTPIYPDCQIEVLRLYTMAKAIFFNESVKLASTSSAYSNCSKVYIGSRLAEISHFIKCTVIITNSADNMQLTHKPLLACCSFYGEHACKPWYGYPTEVWSTATEAEDVYIQVEKISHRVVFVKTKVNFGRRIGEDIVLIVTPVTLNIHS